MDVRALLLTDSQAADEDLDFVSQLTGEVSGASYARATVTGEAVVHDAGDRFVITSDPVAFSAVDVGLVDKMALFVQVTDDTDSWIVAFYDVRSAGGSVYFTQGGDLTVPPHPIDGWIAVT